jgi:hypothetical protein
MEKYSNKNFHLLIPIKILAILLVISVLVALAGMLLSVFPKEHPNC